MKQKILVTIIFGLISSSCQEKEKTSSIDKNTQVISKWNIEKLRNRANQHLDSATWDAELLKQDIEIYNKYSEIFQSYPLNNSPFPVAEYDYAVSAVPCQLLVKNSVFEGVRIGEYISQNVEQVRDKLTLLVLTNTDSIKSDVLVDSRNYPYLTAEGYFKVSNNDLDWVFNASPDGYSTLMINMKLFDLRFGETIIIYPQKDKSFYYHQFDFSPDDFESVQDFENEIKTSKEVLEQVSSVRNID